MVNTPLRIRRTEEEEEEEEEEWHSLL